MIRHEKVLPQEEVQFARCEYSVFATVIHRMDHHEQIGRESIVLLWRVFLDLRGCTYCDAVLNRKRMKMKNLFQHRLAFLCCRVFQVHPKKEIGVGQQGRHQKDVEVLGV